MPARPVITARAGLIAVLTAFVVGALASLALRPPGGGTAATGAAEGAGQVAERIRWRVPTAFGTNLPALGDNILHVADSVRRTSGGAIRLQPFEPGELVPPFNITEAVRERKVPAGYTWLGYDQGRIPASVLLAAVPFGMEPWSYMAWWYERGGRELGRELYHRHEVHPVLCGLIGPETAGWFRTPIESLADVRGLKIRFAGLGGKILERLDASVTMIPGSELFQSLDKGAIDATEYSLPVVDQRLGFDRVAKYNYFPGWHQTFTAFHLVVNLEVWRSLSERDRALLETACAAGVSRNLARSEALQGAVIQRFEQRGVSAQRLPMALLRELQGVARDVMAEEAERDASFARIWRSQQAFMKEYEIWKRLGYLPRDF